MRKLGSKSVQKKVFTSACHHKQLGSGIVTPPLSMHEHTPESHALREKVWRYAKYRLDLYPVPLDGPVSPEQLAATGSGTITEEGIGGDAALDVFRDVFAPASISVDHPGYLAFIPSAATEAASVFDMVVSASSLYGGSWLEGSGAVFAENQVLEWLAAEVGLPTGAGGVFVQGGTIGNLSALVAAREAAIAKKEAAGLPIPARWSFVCSSEGHSSLAHAARVMSCDIITVPVDENGRLTGEAIEAIVEDWSNVFAVVATAGTTNFGIVDRLRSVGEVAQAHDVWFHVDGAYGIAGLLSPAHKPLYDGVQMADSFIVDPHKWLYAPYDACALIYRDPELGRRAHTQHGEYLDVVSEADEWNPSDYAIHLTRRARGLPFWFSLATYGVKAYRETIAYNIEVAQQFADMIRERPYVKLVRDPELSIVVWERIGWEIDDYKKWSQKLIDDQIALVTPSSHQGRPNARVAILNPQTSLELLVEILDTMAD
jgi:L-2,4-diaminobutyrate decarboxylase